MKPIRRLSYQRPIFFWEKKDALSIGSLYLNSLQVALISALVLGWTGMLSGNFATAEDRHSSKRNEKIEVEDAWVRSVPSSSRHTAAYMVLQNHGSMDDRLLSAHSDIVQVVELHEVVMIGKLMSMRPVEYFPIPALGSTELKPGGYHLMLINLKRVLKAGEHVSLTLKFQHAGDLTLLVKVQSEKMEQSHSEKGHDSSQKEHKR